MFSWDDSKQNANSLGAHLEANGEQEQEPKAVDSFMNIYSVYI